ncbi:DUF3237 family protein [Paenibacillus xylaniclasticus]|uniref:DUF3237 family protein n=1 Tax=Paenibacillus xylaniclasticus TaxID=588083 RepID=UPI000FD91A82|nr:MULTISPECIES: DUF3237 family protein [Paenibacillus]GFN30866.1 hypothetical protein PCURB6_11260 [Paenibacillus curdlanolyticus]
MELEEIFTVHVKIEQSIDLHNEIGDTVVMISFSGNVTGKYFQGKVLDGGIDTQIIGKSGERHTLSARYMLEGTDHEGQACRIYIENNGDANIKWKDAMFRTYPKLITNSKALSFLNHDLFLGEGIPTESGVDIKIYRWVS